MAKEPEDVELEGGARPAKARAALPLPLIAGGAVALLGLGAAGFMFMQLQKAKSAPEEEVQPRGVGEHAEAATVGEVSEAEEVVYELGEFTANTADGKYTKMHISLKIESYYSGLEWAAYEHQLELYEEQLKAYLESLSGAPAEEGAKGGHARALSTRLLALLTLAGSAQASAAAKEEAAAPTRPEKPARPLTLAEQKLAEHEPEIRDLVIEQINTHTAAQLTSAEGREEFKQALIKALNELLDPRDGQVLEVYFSELVTT